MNIPTRLAATLVAALTLSGTAALAQQKAPADCPPPPSASPGTEPGAAAPVRITGEVVDIDRANNRITLRADDGRTYQFQTNQQTLQNVNKGDRLEARVNRPPGC